MRILVTGSSGLVGSEAVRFFDAQGHTVWGIDNNIRRDFFGPEGDTAWNRRFLEEHCPRFTHCDIDIRNRERILAFFSEHSFEIIIHTAAQPSHDLAADRPFDDFDVNAVGTLNLLEACRRNCPEAVFIHLSTNKVYGDGPNTIEMEERETRWDYADPAYTQGIPEDFPIDNCLHSLFGSSKAAADLLAQEYGRYFGMRTGIFRGGCLTGPRHSGVGLHGFLNYLVLVSLREEAYTIFGYKGKQVRDQLHSYDVIQAFWEFAKDPKPGEVYNLGGGKQNAASVIESLDLVESVSGKRPRVTYSESNRVGDHICYYSDLRKLQRDFPNWRVTHTLNDIVEEMVRSIHDQGRR